MRSTLLSVDLRSASFWCRVGIVSFVVFSFYWVGVKYASSFDYPFLTDPHTVQFFKKSKTIVIVQDNDHLKNKIREIYGEIAVFCTSKEESELVGEVESLCNEGKNVIVVTEEKTDDRSIGSLTSLAEKFKYSIYITKPREGPIPLYAGWLLDEHDSKKLLSEGKNILKDSLETVPEFSSSFKSFSQQPLIENMLKYYLLASSNANGMLHCTAKYLGKGMVPGSSTYWQKPDITTNVGRCYDIDVIGFVWTPRTFGARVKLSKEELQLWGNDEDNVTSAGTDSESGSGRKPDFSPVKGRGRRAHITIGVAPGVSAVVTGEDLLGIVALEALGEDWPTYPCKYGWLRDYSGGKWVLYLNGDISVRTMFDGVYGSD